MNILLLTPRLPFPPVGGDRLRIFTYIRHLCRDHRVTLLSFVEDPKEALLVDPYRGLVADVELIPLPRRLSLFNCVVGLFSPLPLQVHYYRSQRMRQAVQRRLSSQRFDLILVHLIRMAEYVKECNQAPRVIELTDALSLNHLRAGRYRAGVFKFLDIVERERVRRYELQVLNQFEKSLMISPVDRAYLWSVAGRNGIDIVPIGVNIDYFRYYEGRYDPKSVVFIGNMRTFPNRDSAIYFAREVLPLCREKVADLRFTVVGMEPGREVLALRQLPGVEVTGPVDDVRPYLQEAVASVCPMRVGAGAKNKVLESLALGTPVVATTTGIEGVDIRDGDGVLVGDTPESLARNLVRLVHDGELRRRLARRGRRIVENRFAVDRTLKNLDMALHKAVGGR